MTWGRARLNTVRGAETATPRRPCLAFGRPLARKEEHDIWKRSDGREWRGMEPDENQEPMRDAHELRPSEAIKGIPDDFCPASSN
jgi:hypothetical protein